MEKTIPQIREKQRCHEVNEKVPQTYMVIL